MSDLSGEWDGHFDYPAGLGPSTPFIAVIAHEGSGLSGTITEPDLYTDAAPAEAAIEGIVSSGTVDFTKTYRQACEGYETPVDYTGRILDDGTRIMGHWSVVEMTGTFEMTKREERAAARSREDALERTR